MILYGASGHAKVIIDILSKNGIDVSAILDDNVSIKSLNGYKVTHQTDFNTSSEEMIISIGDNKHIFGFIFINSGCTQSGVLSGHWIREVPLAIAFFK